jgi:hypothetical protein
MSSSLLNEHPNANKPGYEEIFCRFITKNGKRIYARNGGVFHFWMKSKSN